jgi:hypothetical protein
VADALRMATAELQVRRDGYGYDAAAWVLLAAGRVGDARADSDRALAAGAPDARVAYHAGMIAKAQGDVARARRLLSLALHRSPRFDVLQSRRARKALADLN